MAEQRMSAKQILDARLLDEDDERRGIPSAKAYRAMTDRVRLLSADLRKARTELTSLRAVVEERRSDRADWTVFDEPTLRHHWHKTSMEGGFCPDCERVVLKVLKHEVEAQDERHFPGFPATRDGVRLALAAVEDELREARDAHREGRQKEDWIPAASELVQVAAVCIRAARSVLQAHQGDVPWKR